MALTSTAFMAAAGGYSTTLSVKLDRVDCSQVLAAVLNADTGLLGHIKIAGVAENIETNWIEDELTPAYVKCSSSTNVTITCSAGYSDASLLRFLRDYTVLQPEGTEIAVQMLGTIASKIATIGAYASTTWASWTMTKCFIVAQPYADNADASEDMSQLRKKRKNFTQVFERAVAIEQTRKNMSMEAVSDELQLQIKYRTLEIKRELELSVIRGFTRTNSGVTGDHERRTMAGIIQLIRDWDLDLTLEDTTVINASAALTIGHINSLAYKVFDQGGLDETSSPVLVVGPAQARVVAAFESYLRRVEQGERQVGYYRNVFLTDMGTELPVVVSRWMPKDKVILLDRSRCFLKPLRGDSWHLEKMAKTGRSEKWQLSGQYTLQLNNADKCHGLLINCT